MGDVIQGAFGARLDHLTRRSAQRVVAVKVLVDGDAVTAVLREKPAVGAAIGIGGLALMVTGVKDVAGGGAIITCEKIRLRSEPHAAS